MKNQIACVYRSAPIVLPSLRFLIPFDFTKSSSIDVDPFSRIQPWDKRPKNRYDWNLFRFIILRRISFQGLLHEPVPCLPGPDRPVDVGR